MLKRTGVSGALTAAVLTVLSSVASAQVMSEMDVYLGFSVASLNTSVEFPDLNEPRSDEGSITSGYGRLGVFINPNFSAEARVGFGFNEDTVTFDRSEVGIEIGNYYGVYLRGGLPLNEMFYPYAVFGYTQGETTLTLLGDSVTASETDLSYGVGADINFDHGFAANIEYITLLDKEVQLGGFSIGVSKSF